MNTVMPQEKLREVFDRITRDVTQTAAGLRLVPGGDGPKGDVCTVYIGFNRGFHSGLTLSADRALLTRLARTVIQTEEVTAQDLEDVTKEYFNVLCGHIAQKLYRAVKVASRFSVPFFCPGPFSPPGQKEQFSLNYTDDRHAAARLVHHIPEGSGPEDGAPAELPAARSKKEAILS